MKKETPLVSIITPLHNAAQTIVETMDSIAAQTLPDWEHLIIDNNSTDNGPDLVRARAKQDPRVRLHQFTNAQSAGLTRNVGIEAAKGRYIAFLDADDTWDAEKLEKQIALMEKQNLAFSWTSYRVNTGADIMHVRQASAQATADDLLAKRAVIGCLTTIYDTHQLGKVFMTDIKKRQDFVLFVTLLKMAEKQSLRVGGLTEILATYRLMENSLSSNKLSAAQYQWKSMREDLEIPLLQSISYFISYMTRGIQDRLKITR